MQKPRCLLIFEESIKSQEIKKNSMSKKKSIGLAIVTSSIAGFIVWAVTTSNLQG